MNYKDELENLQNKAKLVEQELRRAEKEKARRELVIKVLTVASAVASAYIIVQVTNKLEEQANQKYMEEIRNQ